jgi:predicted CXXCH cytochrome family protein
VINGKLWESSPNKVPACIDCHQPHDIRQVIYEEKYTDQYCMNCHKDKKLSKLANGKKESLFVDYAKHEKSVHKDNTCIKCHTNISISNNPVCENSGRVDCSSCHAEVVSNYTKSIHGQLHSNGNVNAPYCTDCHGKHSIKSKKGANSQTARQNIPALCSKCHREGEKAAVKYTGKEHNIIKNYEMSIHGQGLLKSGLVVSATCIDCHTSHIELPASDTLSSVNRKNLPNTCSKCHLGIYEEFNKSVHSSNVTKTDKKLPDCYNCHKSHTIERVDKNDFRQSIVSQCGQCHKDVTESYFETFHGKVTKLGSAKTAKCSDCHGAHNILPTENPKSTLSYQNIVKTCAKCHPNSNRKFVGYLTHATHHNKHKYPYLYYTYLFMTILLIGTFSFFGIHTLLWLPRALVERKKEKNREKERKRKSNKKEESENE